MHLMNDRIIFSLILPKVLSKKLPRRISAVIYQIETKNMVCKSKSNKQISKQALFLNIEFLLILSLF